MSTTTQILFNSPALHSLKREQLVKLCKIHSVKANGKNVEMIQRLRQHAQTLPKDSPLSIAARSEPSGPIPIQPMDNSEDSQEDEPQEEIPDASYRSAMPRPSEQWEMVMDSIEEVEENSSSQGTLSSQRTLNNGGTGEFGTGSSRSTTVGSSIKALANSLGLKRAMSKVTPVSTASSKASATSQITQPDAQTNEPVDDLAHNSKPYASLPLSTSLPQTDHFTLESGRVSFGSTTDTDGSPLPGNGIRTGVPAPPNARLSMGLGLGAPSTPTRAAQPTTTIRLVSNPLAEQSHSINLSYGAGENGTPQLKPFATNFDITFGSPAPTGRFGFGFGSLSSWPPRAEGEDVEMAGIYPKLTFDDLPPTILSPPARLTMKAETSDDDADMPSSMLHTPPPKDIALAAIPQPFVFGSPLPQHRVSNTQFRSAAASVLEEMNARLRAEGVEEIGFDIVGKLHPDKKVIPADMRAIKPIPASKRGEVSSKFEKAHQEEFNRMEGIDGVLKRRMERENASPGKRNSEEREKEKVVVGRKRKSSVLEPDASSSGRPGGPRRPSVLAPKPRASSTRVISSGRRAKVIPGAFGMDDDDDDEDAEENNSRIGKRVRMDPDAAPVPSVAPEDQAKQDKELEERRLVLEKEKETIKKKIDANRARRRSSAAAGGRKSIGGAAGRKSIGRNGPRPSLLAKQKPKPSRFGFLSSAKSLVQNVWNRGKAPTPAAAAGPSSIPKPASIVTKPEPEAGKEKEKLGPPSLGPTRKSVMAPAKPTTVPSVKINTKQATTTVTTQLHAQGSIASTSRSRSPLPSFGTMSSIASGSNGTGSGRNSLQSNNGSRLSSLAGTGKSRTSALSSGVSSVGTRLSAARVSATGTGASGVGSMGLRKAAAAGASRTSSIGTAASLSSRLSRLSTSSRLFAPTASSLAKASRRSSAAVPPVPAVPSGLRPVSEDKLKEKEKSALGLLTNSPTANGAASPRPGKIFSKPIVLPAQSGIPTPVKKRSTESVREDGSSTTIVKPRSLSGRKPRISRSKVIARLASQRAASGSSLHSNTSQSSTSSALKPRASGGGRTRSSLGAKASRASYGGGLGKGRASGGVGGGGMAMSAKRRARQSEYIRRKSRGAEVNNESNSMDVDA